MCTPGPGADHNLSNMFVYTTLNDARHFLIVQMFWKYSIVNRKSMSMLCTIIMNPQSELR